MSSVGQGGVNRREDVLTLQQLLNLHLSQLMALQPLRIDGLCGPKTIAAIKEFQKRVLHLANPDGRVDPHGSTMLKLGDINSAGTTRAGTHRYRIRTIVGGGLAVGVGGSVTTFELQDLGTLQRAFYTLTGLDVGFGFKGGGQGPSSWTEFSSDRRLQDFHGRVQMISASFVAVGGGGAFSMEFKSGPAMGEIIPGIGWATGLGASLTGTIGLMKLRE